ncbi:hypothetical protein OOZ51_15545 [Arthrobacter sp. MI7-26]|uniref:hypothetical protein n=1 Tax=Arthrobacter sp. MI7-26 TaxID=2993653 RepID=UPI0022498950|nr:hypothetical protein [Arthrobacter sp. MI7-26]MCX2749221.1 hypothetical protein [Arthrobacter sp. MI7-26]
MTGLNETSHALQHRTADWIKHAIQDPSPQTEAAVRWALSRLGEANVPEVVHAVVLTLTGKKKAAGQARKAAATAVQRAERKLRRADRGHRKAWLAAGFLAAVAAAAVLTWRGLAANTDPQADTAADTA